MILMKNKKEENKSGDFYFVTGLYQLFVVTCLKLQENKDRCGTCVIVDCFDQARVHYERVSKSNIFDEVLIYSANILNYDIFSDRFPWISYLWRSKSILFYKTGFEKVFLAGHYNGMYFFAHIQKKRHKAQIILFDDGLGRRIVYNNSYTPSMGILGHIVQFCER